MTLLILSELWQNKVTCGQRIIAARNLLEIKVILLVLKTRLLVRKMALFMFKMTQIVWDKNLFQVFTSIISVIL